jgi:hypothetical protein
MAETKQKTSQTSLRNPLAALANVFEKMGDREPNNLYRAQRRREAAKLRELASREPAPKQPKA